MGLQEVIEQQHERSRQLFAGQVSKCTSLAYYASWHVGGRASSQSLLACCQAHALQAMYEILAHSPHVPYHPYPPYAGFAMFTEKAQT